MSDLKRDEYYFLFVQDLASELAADARQAFIDAGCDAEYRAHFLRDLADAMAAQSRLPLG